MVEIVLILCFLSKSESTYHEIRTLHALLVTAIIHCHVHAKYALTPSHLAIELHNGANV